MWTIVFLVGGVIALAMIFSGRDKPTEFGADIWVPDPEERKQRLAAATAAWKEGRRYLPPEKLDHWRPASPVVLADPNADDPLRRWVRDHPMRRPRWK